MRDGTDTCTIPVPPPTGVDLTGYTSGQRYAWAVYLAEMLLHNTALQALTLPSQPLFLPLEAWATINRALCLNPRPRVHAWGLADAGMGDEGLAAMLPSWSRIFSTQVRVCMYMYVRMHSSQARMMG